MLEAGHALRFFSFQIFNILQFHPIESLVEAMSKGFCCIGLFNPKTPENVGSVLRAAGCYGVNSVFYTGVRYDRAKEFVTDTKKVHQKIPLIGIEDLQQVIPLGCTPVAVELIKGAKPLPEYTHPERAFYIFGPEDGTLDKTVRAWCEDVVYIPTIGCMNLAATVNVVLYDRLAKAHLAHLKEKT